MKTISPSHTTTPTGAHIAVVGAGVSGLKTLHTVLTNDPTLIASVTLFDAQGEPGGVLTHTREQGFLCEHGAQAVLLTKKSFMQSLRDLEIEDQVRTPPPGQTGRYVFYKGRCVRLSRNLWALWRAGIVNAVSLVKIVRFLFTGRVLQPGFYETLYEFFNRVFGKRIADALVIPFSFGVWGGGARRLVCRFCLPGLAQTQFQKPGALASFREGMQTLPRALFDDIVRLCREYNVAFHVHWHTPVTSIAQRGGQYVINTEWVFESVVFAGQPWRTRVFLLGEESFEPLQILYNIPTHTLVVVGLGGQKSAPEHNYAKGFGALAEEAMPGFLGVLFVHNLYPDHVPAVGFLYRLFWGGEKWADVANFSKEDFVKKSQALLEKYKFLSVKDKPTFVHVGIYDNYVPLATAYQDQVLQALLQLECANPGLFFVGNYKEGVSVADCLSVGQKTAHKITRYLEHIEKDPNDAATLEPTACRKFESVFL